MKKILKNFVATTLPLLIKTSGSHFARLSGPSKIIPYVIIFLSAPICFAQDSNIWVTVYSQNFGLVKEVRSFELKKGTQEIQLREIPALIDPTSVHLRSLTAPKSVSILEQYFENDVVDPNKILSKHIDKEIEISTSKGEVLRGKLLNAGADLVIALSNGEIMLIRNKETASIKFPGLPEGLVTKPSLTWVINSESNKEHQFEMEYLTRGLNWHAEYVAILAADEATLDIGAWMNIDNKSGASYNRARLNLVAGDVNLAQERGPTPRFKMLQAEAMSVQADVAERESFEYHLYTIERPVTLTNNQLKQISFFDAEHVKVNKKYVLDIMHDNKKVRVYLRFRNEEKNKLGLPFPAGRFRVYKREDAEGSIFLGEDRIKHTPENEWLEIFVGAAFDLTADRKQVKVERIAKQGQLEAYEITLRNHKSRSVTVAVIEHFRFRMPTSGWKIIESNYDYTAKDARSVEFMVEIPEDEERKLSYSVEYSW